MQALDTAEIVSAIQICKLWALEKPSTDSVVYERMFMQALDLAKIVSAIDLPIVSVGEAEPPTLSYMSGSRFMQALDTAEIVSAIQICKLWALENLSTHSVLNERI